MARLALIVARIPEFTETRGYVARVSHVDGEVWYIALQPTHASQNVVARCLAVLLVDKSLQFLPRQHVPAGPPIARLTADTSFSNARGDAIGGVYDEEVERVASALNTKDAAYFRRLADVLRTGQAPPSFAGVHPAHQFYTPLPDGPLFQECWIVPQPPTVPVRGRPESI
jgi:hypothetical protein